MSKRKPFEEMDSNQAIGHLLDENADMIQHARDSAFKLLEMANNHEERATKLRHLAAVLILEAQNYAGEVAELMEIEFPMGDYESQADSEEEENEDE